MCIKKSGNVSNVRKIKIKKKKRKERNSTQGSRVKQSGPRIRGAAMSLRGCTHDRGRPWSRVQKTVGPGGRN